MAGKWFSDTDDTYKSSDYISAVITNDSGYSVGDVLSSEIIMRYDDNGNVSAMASVKYKIIGILNDNTAVDHRFIAT